MASPLDDLLKRVADGELSPEQALRLIDGDLPPADGAATGAGHPAAPSPAVYGTPSDAGPAGDTLHEPGSGRTQGDPRPGRPRPGAPVRAVRVVTAYRQVTVVADPTVAQVHVSGKHTVRREGDRLVVEGSWNPLAVRLESDEPGLRFAFVALPRGLATAGSELTVRINPELRLEVDATGASLRICGPEAGARLRLLASSVKVDRLRGPLDLDARTSSVKGSLGPWGQSRIAAEQSSVKVSLLPGSGLHITAANRMGKVVLPGQVSKDGGFGESLHAQVGVGDGSLVVDASMSSVVITAEGFGGSR